MLASFVTTLLKRLGGSFAQQEAADNSLKVEDTIGSLFDFQVQFQKAADDAMASTATADTKFWTNPYTFPVQVFAASYNADGTITADDTNFATVTVKADDGAAGATVAVATWLTKITAGTGNIAAQVAKAATTLNASTIVSVAPGASLFFNIAKSGSGVVVRSGIFTLRMRKV
jgi:hypothetical protein